MKIIWRVTWAIALGRARTPIPWTILNHESWRAETFTSLGVIGADRLSELTGGLMTDTTVEVRINRHVAEADVAIVVGPVFPRSSVLRRQQVFLSGVSGPELINLSHWVGALITSAEMIGTRGVTGPSPRQRSCQPDPGPAAGVVPGGRFGHRHVACCRLRDAGGRLGSLCRDLGADAHHLPGRPVHRVLSIMPTKYEDIWTAAKGFYKLEPIVADGGEVIIYAHTSPRYR